MIITRFRQSVLAALLAALVLAGLSPVAAQAVDGPQFAVSPTSGRPGEPIQLTGIDLCPPIPDGYGDMPYQDVVINFVDSAGVSSGDRNLGGIGEGAWSAQPFFPSPHFPPPFDATKLTPEPALGMGMLHARCVLPDGTVSLEYAPQPFNVTARPHRFTASSSVDPGDAVHVESIDPCPQPQDRVQLSVFNGQYASNLDVTPNPDGTWSADILTSYEEMDGSRTPFAAGPIGLSASCMTDATAQTSFVYASVASSVNGTSGEVTCKDAVFIAVTGSGEYFDGAGNLSVSPTLKKVYSGFTAVFDEKGKTYKKRVLDYPALSVDTLFEDLDSGSTPANARQLFQENLPKYLAGKDAGITALYSAVANSRAKCPSQDIVLAGYSQGAMVVHEFLQEYAATSGPNKHAIKAVVLVADPMRVGNSEVFNFGDAPSDSRGICKYMSALINCNTGDTVREVPALYRSSTIAMCNQYDIVCDTPTAVSTFWSLGLEQIKSTGTMVHEGYAADQYTKTAGKRAARQVLNN